MQRAFHEIRFYSATQFLWNSFSSQKGHRIWQLFCFPFRYHDKLLRECCGEDVASTVVNMSAFFSEPLLFELRLMFSSWLKELWNRNGICQKYVLGKTAVYHLQFIWQPVPIRNNPTSDCQPLETWVLRWTSWL